MSTATLTLPLAQPAIEATMVQAAREAAGMFLRHQSALWEAYVKRALQALEGAFVASHTPEQLAASLRWMIPALSPAERELLLAGPRQSLPSEAFDELLGHCVALLDAASGAHLRSAFCSGPRERGGWAH
jgi:hypothetical protein